MSPLRLWKHLTEQVLDLLLPPLCLACNAPVGTDKTLCPACWKSINFISSPLCACCGMPFEVPVGDGMLCGGCIANPPAFNAARAPMLYDDASRKLTLSFKHGDRIHPTKAMAAWMHRAGQEFWVEADCLIPVPLHRWRLFKRRYNQAALLAQALSKIAQKPVLVDGLKRIRPTPTQGHRGRKERFENVKNAFAPHSLLQDKIKGKTVVLVDDIMTTGATVNECSRILLKAGAKTVNVLTLGRVRGYD